MPLEGPQTDQVAMKTFVTLATSYAIMLALTAVGAVWAVGFASDLVVRRYVTNLAKKIR